MICAERSGDRVVPANPRYYDIVHAFDDTDEIDWKQGAGIKTGDTVFMYVASPVSAILYKCKVTERDTKQSERGFKVRLEDFYAVRM